MYKINLVGDIGEDESINFQSFQDTLNNANGNDLEITINTPGGCLDTAFDIYNLLETYKRDNKAIVTTVTNEQCASSGIILLLAGNRRIVNNNTEPFIHEAHFHIENAIATANELINAGYDLEDSNYKIASLYAQKTALDYDQARELMKLETSFTPEEAYNLGFATEKSKVYNKYESPKLIIYNKLKSNINNKSINMSKDNKIFDQILNLLKGRVSNKVELTVSGDEVNFPDLSPDDVPKVGDAGFVDGKPAELEYRMQDGRKYVFADGKLTKIFEPGENDPDENKADNEALNTATATIETLRTEIDALQSQNTAYKTAHDQYNQLQSAFLEMKPKNEIKSPKENKQDDGFGDLSDINTTLNKLK